MSMSSFNGHNWDRMKLRTLSISQLSLPQNQKLRERYIYTNELSSKDQSFIHRLVLLLWINEIEWAKKFWKETRSKKYFFGDSLADFIYKVIIYEKELGWGFRHPEFSHVRYVVLDEKDAFKLSTMPLSGLLKMDDPHFSSIDGFMDVRFDKHELKRVAEMVPQEHRERLRLPLILLGSMDEYREEYKVIGGKLENFLLQKLLKLNSTPFEKYLKTENIEMVNSITTLKRRKFGTIYKIFPEYPSSIWLSVLYKNPFFP